MENIIYSDSHSWFRARLHVASKFAKCTNKTLKKLQKSFCRKCYGINMKVNEFCWFSSFSAEEKSSKPNNMFQ